MCCMFPDVPLEQERHSGGLPNILTAAHSRGREGGREGRKEMQREEREREKTSYSLMLHLTFSFSSYGTSHFLSLEFQQRSYFRIILTFNYKSFQVSCHTCGDAVREHFKLDFQRPDILLTWPMESNP